MLPTHPRVNIPSKPTAYPPTNSPCKYLAYKDRSLANEIQSHRHPNHSKGKLENVTMQLEQNRMKDHLSGTFNFSDMNAANPPNKPKRNKLIQGKNKENGCK